MQFRSGRYWAQDFAPLHVMFTLSNGAQKPSKGAVRTGFARLIFAEICGQNGSKHQHTPLQRHSVHFAEFVRELSKMVSVISDFSFVFCLSL